MLPIHRLRYLVILDCNEPLTEEEKEQTRIKILKCLQFEERMIGFLEEEKEIDRINVQPYNIEKG